MIYGRLTKASDVYSFGIVLLVVLSGMPAFDSSRPEQHRYVKDWYVTCSDEANFDELIDPKLVGGIPSASLVKFVQLIKSCLHEHPKRRPVMAQVVVYLEESLDLLDKEQREVQSAVAQQALQLPDTSAEHVKRRAEIARLREVYTLKGDVESVMKLKGLDIEAMHQNYTV